jgi:hypothetical protein
MRAARMTPEAVSAMERGDIAKARRLIEQSGCPLCRARDEAVTHAIAWLWVEGYNDWEWRERLAASAGMCRQHWWQALTSERSHAFGASAVGESFTQASLRQLEKCEQDLHQAPAANGFRNSAGERMRQWWAGLRSARGQRSSAGASVCAPPTRACPLCETAELEERFALRRLYLALAESEVWAQYEHSDGLCLAHLRWALTDPPSPAVALALIADMRRRLGALSEEFAHFFHTMDYRFHDEPRGSEQTAWLRAIERFTGPTPWPPPAPSSQSASASAPPDAHDPRDTKDDATQEAHS